MDKEQRRTDPDLDELDQIIDKGTSAPLSEADVQKLKDALHSLYEEVSASTDAKFKSALDAGHFDDQIGRAVADDKAGRTKPLEEVLRDPRPKNQKTENSAD